MLIRSCESLGEAHLLRVSDILEDIGHQTSFKPVISVLEQRAQGGEDGRLHARGGGARMQLINGDGEGRMIQRLLKGRPGRSSAGFESTLAVIAQTRPRLRGLLLTGTTEPLKLNQGRQRKKEY